ncbi:MAG: hypothetical protein KGL02_06435, partial [Acidobacteriota bacterium]|nr:hypothetical protein [Acidobacteriota bacterium]
MKLRPKHGFFAALLIVALVIGLAIAALESGVVERWMRRAVISQIDARTGMRAEIQSFRFQPTRLRVEIGGLTLHGLEAAGAPPLFHADRI